MAVSGKGKGKGKGKRYESDDGKKASDKGKKIVLDKGKTIVRNDDEEEEEDNENEEYIIDEAEEEGEENEDEKAGYSSGEAVKVTRKKRHKSTKDRFELDEEDYDLLEDANVTGFHRPANLGGKFKRLKKAGHAPGRKHSGTVREEKDGEEEEESDEDDEEMEVEDDEERDEYKLTPKNRSQKKGGKQAHLTSVESQRGAQKRNEGSKPSQGERRRVEREILASLNEATVDSDDNDGNDRESLFRRLLDKQFESSLPEVNYLKARDDLLRRTDVPERLQILEEAAAALPSSDLELRQTAEWIFDRAFGDLCIPSRPEFQHLLNIEKPEVVRQIANVLHLVHNEKLEVPYIGLYRREECLDLLKEESVDEFLRDEGPKIHQYKALWAVQEWNKKWLLLQRRKSELHAGFKERVPVDLSSTSEMDKLVKNIFCFIEDAESEQVLHDFEAQFNLHFPRDESEVVDSKFKRPRFRSLYNIGHQAGLGAITKHFGLASEAFGDNVKTGFKKHDVLDEAFLPDDLATKFVSSSGSKSEFQDSASLIRGARHMLAMEISSEPSVREYIRAFYSRNAVVTTKPTSVGINAIDAFHQFEGVKWINEKPISAFDDEQWLLIQKAEDEKLIDVTVGLPKESIDSILFECQQLFSSDGESRTSQAWNEQRKQILQEAVVTLLLPIMEKEVRMSLVTRAKQLLVSKCGLHLWNKVSVAPYNPASGNNMRGRKEDGPAVRVLACCWGPPNIGTTFVMLDADGGILNTMHTGYLNIRALSPEQVQRKENDKARLIKLLLDYKPHVIVLGAAKVQCRYLSQDISDVLFMLAEQHAGDSAEGQDTIKLVYGDESIPSLFETSRISQKQLPGQPGTVRRAVALGRFLQNPVAMVASLFGPSREILLVKFHPLQSFLSDEELYDVLERVMITVVNQVGIDINLATMHDWLFETLQFVAGLGPRKAEVIRTALAMAGRVVTRNDLCSTIRAMEENVFINCAGFICVRVIGQSSSEFPHQEALDNTRIHPEWYQMARNLAEAATEKEAIRNNEEVDVDVLKIAVEHVMKNPDILDTVDIEEYSQSVQVEGRSKRIQTFDLIKSELQQGFQEWRKPYLEPTNEECFFLMTGESQDTLFPGQTVRAMVRKIQEHQVMCVLECGLLGFIQKEDLSDDGDVEPKDKFTVGTSVICRVKEVKMDKYLVDLTCKESDLRGYLSRDVHNHDKHYKPDTTFLVNEQGKTWKWKENNSRKTFKTRPIVHPKFQNMSTEDAIKALGEKDVGDFIIRPSCKGPAHLTITMKVSDGLFSHVDVAESDKETWDLESFLRLGKALTIGDNTYKSIDEMISKYVNQVVTRLQEILKFRKHREGNKSEIADALCSEKTENPRAIPYCLSIAHEYPGAFMLSYVRATTPCHEYISVEPSGFRFRKKAFDNVDSLVGFFKSHFHDPVPEKMTPWGGGRGRGRGRGDRGRGDRGRGRGWGDRGRGQGDRSGRGWGRRGRGGDRFGNDSEAGGWDRKKPAWGNDGSPTHSNGRGHDWNSTRGDDRGTTRDNNDGGANWNDTADGGGDSTWGDKGCTATNTGGDVDGWGEATNGSGGGGGWDSWNDPPANGRGGAETKAASGGGGWNNWNETPADGGGNVGIKLDRERGTPWGDKSGKAINTEGGEDAWGGATNAAIGEGDWDIGKGDSDKAQEENVTKTTEVDSAWDHGTKSTRGTDDGWDSVPASTVPADGGWGSVPASTKPANDTTTVDDGWGSVPSSTKPASNATTVDDGWGSVPASTKPANNTTTVDDGWGSVPSSTKPASNTTTVDDGWGSVPSSTKLASNTATVDDGWGGVPASTGGGKDGWDTLPQTESGGGWDAIQTSDAVADDPWGSVGGGSSSGGWGQQESGNDRGWDRQQAQRGDGHWDGGGGGRGSRNDDGRWEYRGGRGNRDDRGRWENNRGGRGNGGRWGGRGGHGSENEGRADGGGRWGNPEGGRGEGGRRGGRRGGRGFQNDGGRWGSGSDHCD